jgi:hypothetical protein
MLRDVPEFGPYPVRISRIEGEFGDLPELCQFSEARMRGEKRNFIALEKRTEVLRPFDVP